MAGNFKRLASSEENSAQAVMVFVVIFSFVSLGLYLDWLNLIISVIVLSLITIGMKVKKRLMWVLVVLGLSIASVILVVDYGTNLSDGAIVFRALFIMGYLLLLFAYCRERVRLEFGIYL